MKVSRSRLYGILLLLTSITAFFKLHEFGSFQVNKEETPTKAFVNASLMRDASVDTIKPKLKKWIDSLLKTQNRSGQIDAKLWIPQMQILTKSEFVQVWLRFRVLLCDWWKNRRFNPDVMSNLVNQISNGKYYKTCAIVGNSGVLLRSEHGHLIDTHDVVVRLNNARTNGYEPHVGAKTNISFVSSGIVHSCAIRESCSCYPYGEKVPTIVHICRPQHLLDTLVCNSSYKSSPLIVIDPQIDVLCTRIFNYYSLRRFYKETRKDARDWQSFHSSGMLAVTLALGICEKVSLFGFGKSNLVGHHYHDNQTTEYGFHDYEAEYEFYHDIMEQPDLIPFIPTSFKIPPVVMYR